jgi:tetratricopeptide (TPR) repeat protein
MAIPVKSLEEMIRDVIASLQAGTRGGRPVYTLLLGSGFSYPIVPTPTQMLKSDIAWWRFCKDRRLDGSFRGRSEAETMGLAINEIAEFEKELWKNIHSACAADEQKRFPLGADGLPDLTDPENVGRAYDAVMSKGLLNDRMRRQYLREAIARSGRKVNSAHIFLAGILEVQETWDWGAPFCRTIFTTNFDPLLQRSLQLVNKLYYMTDRPDVLDTPDDDQSDAIHLIYTHGSVHRYGLLNTGDQIEKARKRNAAGLVGYLQRHGVIVMGYSGWRDTTMEALLACSSFDSNLYWCDIHPADQAEARLRPEVLELLRENGKDAYYVHIPSADESMRQLHRALTLGEFPKFILDPIPTLIAQLQSIDVPTAPAGSSHSADAAPPRNHVATLLAGTLQRLTLARRAFDDPKIVQTSSPQAENEVTRALIAHMMRDALLAWSDGRLEDAISWWNQILSTEGVPPTDRARVLLYRGFSQGLQGDGAKEIADYTAVIDMPDALTEQKAQALFNRGVVQGQAGRIAESIADYTAVIGMEDAPAEQKGSALINRGAMQGRDGRSAEAIADYTAVIGIEQALAEQKTTALVNRGVEHAQAGRDAEAIADYTTVIEMADAPAEQKAAALVNRAVKHGQAGRSAESIADCTAVIGMVDAPAEQKMKALVNRGVAHGQIGRIVEAITDYTAVIEMADVPAEQKAKALINRAVAHGRASRSTEAIEDYTVVIGMADAPPEQRAAALVNRGVVERQAGKSAEAIADYTAAIGMRDAPAEQKAMALVNRGWARFLAGDVQALVEDSRQALELAPMKNTARMNLALGLLLIGAADAAAPEHEWLLTQMSDVAPIRAAINDLQTEVMKRPDFRDAERALAFLEGAMEKVQSRSGGSAPP